MGTQPLGLDLAHSRLKRARIQGPVVQGRATFLPFADASLDMVYAAHLVHHIVAYRSLLREVRRCLRPGGTLYLVETVENYPLVRLGRTLHPWWRGDAVETRMYFERFVQAVRAAGLDVAEAGQYSVSFWIWEVLPEHISWLDWVTPLFTALEVLLNRIAGRWAAHCYCVAAPA